MDGESGESMELMEAVPLEELGEAELERLDLIYVNTFHFMRNLIVAKTRYVS